MSFDPIESLPGGKKLLRAIIAGDISSVELRRLPAQHIYMAIQAAGLESMAEIISELSSVQYRLLLDFELWSRDVFEDEHFFEWLGVLDREDSLEPIEQFISSVDREVLALLVTRYVRAVPFEEPTDAPPGDGWYTPDKGHTWLRIMINEPSKHALFGKLMAYIFQRNPELFYQLVLSAGAATPLELEEECYQLRSRRLQDQGIPDHHASWQQHAPLADSTAVRRLQAVLETESPAIELEAEDIPAVSVETRLYQRFLAEIDEEDAVRAESAKLLNAAVVFFGIDFSNANQVEHLAAKVQGAIDIGLQQALLLRPASFLAIYQALGLQGLYQLGLSQLFELRKIAQRIAKGSREPDPAFQRVCELAELPFPEWPVFLEQQEPPALSGKQHGRAFTSLQEVQRVKQILSQAVN